MPLKKKNKTFSDDEDLGSDGDDEILDVIESDSEDELLLKPIKRNFDVTSTNKSKKPKSNQKDTSKTRKSPRASRTRKSSYIEESDNEEDDAIENESDNDDNFDYEVITPRKSKRKVENTTTSTKKAVTTKRAPKKSKISELSEDEEVNDNNSVYNEEEDDYYEKSEEEDLEEDKSNEKDDDDNFEETTSKPKKGRKLSTTTLSTKTKRGGNRGKKSKENDYNIDDDDDEILSINNTSNRKGYSKEQVKYKSSAEFFAENQNIAGFDNAGKALYTSIREMVENSLDATESIQILPDISIKIEELTTDQFNELRGIKTLTRNDESLYHSTATTTTNNNNNNNRNDKDNNTSADDKKNNNSRNTTYYYRLSVKDNGIGMEHSKIGDMFGRVLSGSKYGVRQCRGKFGLGAKMALIWSKKSTGLPISIKTGYSDKPKQFPLKISDVVLDINIHTNEPNILKSSQYINNEQWRGSEISLVIGGNWTSIRSKIIQYFRLLAIITPYANMNLQFICDQPSRCFKMEFARRSDHMPEPSKTIKHHPSSVNNYIIKSIIEQSNCKTLYRLLTQEFSCISPTMALKIINELGSEYSKDMSVDELTPKRIHQIMQLLHELKFPNPPLDCLSPAGEYNLRLGILKEIEPDLVATCADKGGYYEGHPFIVEVAVAVGGKSTGKEGLNVYRFANRIPLLFEGGADVSYKTAMKDINWKSYYIDPKTQKVNVFVSIVSTKIPFKGTGKEYIGNDVIEIKTSVKRAIMGCCQQLKPKLHNNINKREREQRMKILMKYSKTLTDSLCGIIKMSIDKDPNVTPKVIEYKEKIKNKTFSNEILLDKFNETIKEYNAKMLMDYYNDTTGKRITDNIEIGFSDELSPVLYHELFEFQLVNNMYNDL